MEVLRPTFYNDGKQKWQSYEFGASYLEESKIFGTTLYSSDLDDGYGMDFDEAKKAFRKNLTDHIERLTNLLELVDAATEENTIEVDCCNKIIDMHGNNTD